jgi:hypothetical protein
VQFDGFNAITGQHDTDLASMSRLYTDPRLDRQIRLRRSGAYDPDDERHARGTVQVSLATWICAPAAAGATGSA